MLAPYWCSRMSHNSWYGQVRSVKRHSASLPINLYSVKYITQTVLHHRTKSMWLVAQLVQQWDSADQLIVFLFSISAWRLAGHVSLSVMSHSCGSIPFLVHTAGLVLSKNCWSRDSVVTCRRSRASVTRFFTFGLSYGDVPPGERVYQMSEDH